MSNHGRVLCLADQGHIKIEPTRLQHCCDTDCTSSASVPANEDDQHNCVDCSDIPLNSPQLWQRTKANFRPILRLFALNLASLPAGKGAMAEGFSERNLSIGCSQWSDIQIGPATTVLRC